MDENLAETKQNILITLGHVNLHFAQKNKIHSVYLNRIPFNATTYNSYHVQHF